MKPILYIKYSEIFSFLSNLEEILDYLGDNPQEFDLKEWVEMRNLLKRVLLKLEYFKRKEVK